MDNDNSNEESKRLPILKYKLEIQKQNPPTAVLLENQFEHMCAFFGESNVDYCEQMIQSTKEDMSHWHKMGQLKDIDDTSRSYYSLMFDYSYFKKLWHQNKLKSISSENKKLRELEKVFNDRLIEIQNNNLESNLVFNGKEKVILMIELGLIDFLKKDENFKHSYSNMAHFLSKVTGESYSSIQTPLNSYLSDNPNKNPITNTTQSNTRVKEYLVSKAYKK